MIITDVEFSLGQFVDAWKLMAASCRPRRLGSGDGIEYVFAGLPIAFFNLAFVRAPRVSAASLAVHGKDACAWASGAGVPWMLVVTEDSLDPGTDAAAVLDECGLARFMTATGMRAEGVAAAGTPEGLSLAVPQDDAGCHALLEVNSAAYGMDLLTADDPFGRRSFWADHVAVLGSVEGKPVSCATVMMVDGHRYVALVATDPGFQRRGFAAAAMRHALALSARTHGECPTVLHATDAGRPVYERMGYAALATHRFFIEKRFLEGH